MGLSALFIDGKFFINEITRCYNASSYGTGYCIEVNRDWADALAWIATVVFGQEDEGHGTRKTSRKRRREDDSSLD